MSQRHEFQYYGSLNIYYGSNPIQTYDSWRCNKCGIVRICIRRPGKIEPEFLEDPSSPDERWIVLICRTEKPKVEIYSVKPGDVIEHKCVDGKVIEFEIGKNFEARGGKDHYLYKFDEVLNGFIDLSENPPRVVVPKKS